MNIIPLLGLSGMVGVLSGMFGVGGGFILAPLLFSVGTPPTVAVATGASQIVASSFSGVLGHFRRRTVDAVLALTLIVSGVIGAQIGSVIGLKLKPEHLRVLLSMMVLAICIKLGVSLVIEPSEVYSILAR